MKNRHPYCRIREAIGHSLSFCLFLLLAASCSNNRNETYSLTPVDTIYLDYPDVKYVRNHYLTDIQKNAISFEYSGGRGFWVDGEAKPTLFVYDSIEQKNNIRIRYRPHTFWIENPNYALINFNYQDPYFVRIDASGRIVDSIYSNFGGHMVNGIVYQIVSQTNSKSPIIYCRTYPLKMLNSEYYYDSIGRRTRFHDNMPLACCKIENDTLKLIRRFGKFPDLYCSMRYNVSGHSSTSYTFDDKTYYCFTDCDSLFVYDKGEQTRYPLSSRYKTKRKEGLVSPYDSYAHFKNICENQFFSQPLYDKNQKVIFVTSANSTPYEKKDGTLAQEKEKPVSVIVLDSTCKQIAEIDLSNEYQHYWTILTSKGIGFINKQLTTKNRTAYVIFKLTKNEKKH